jgi:hypothetical protein
MYIKMCINFPITVFVLQNNEHGFLLISTINVVECDMLKTLCTISYFRPNKLVCVFYYAIIIPSIYHSIVKISQSRTLYIWKLPLSQGSTVCTSTGSATSKEPFNPIHIKSIALQHINVIHVFVGGHVFQQSVGFPIGANCVLLLADLFLYAYEVEFIQHTISF